MMNRTLVVLSVMLLSFAARGAAAVEWGTLHQTSAKGLSLMIDSRWVSGTGYRPMRIAVTPLVAVAADRTLRVEVTTRQYWTYGNAYHTRIVQWIEIPAGSGPVETVLAIPPSDAPQYQIQVYEAGKEITGFSQGWSGSNVAPSQFEMLPRLLVIGNGTADTTQISDALPAALNSPSPVSAGGRPLRTPLSSAITRSGDVLPQRWIDFSSLDMICLSLEELASVATARQETFRALRQWTAAGGNLLVYGVGSRWERLQQLESFLELPAEPPGESNPRIPAGWLAPREGDYDQFPPGARSHERDWERSQSEARGRTGRGQRGSAETTPQGRAKPATRPDGPHFLYRPLAMGLVVAMSSDKPLPGTDREWNWLLNTVSGTRWRWSMRHGVSMSDNNPDFWRFMIPNVGLAPVGSFQVLITLFVLAIGPANYWLLRRWRRLHLLVVTVPVSAIAVTAALFGYALIADGLGTRLRVRSVTHIDQRRGEAVCWARLSYYSGVAPGGGLRFSADTMVVPYEASPGDRSSESRDLQWRDDQRMTSGWISSRKPAQFLTVRVHESQRGLRIAPQPGETGRWMVENRLGTPIQHVVVRNEKGEYLWADAVAQDASVILTPVDLATAVTWIATFCDEHPLEYPKGLDPQLVNASPATNRRYRYGGYTPSTGQPPASATSRMEETLAALAGRLKRPDLRVLEPGSYAAIVDASPEVEPGTPAAREEAGFHVILGKW